MNVSIRTKLFTLCILLVLLSISGVSVTYYRIAKQGKHRESRQRIQIAFDIMLDDFQNRANAYTTRFDEFLKEDETLRETLFIYSSDEHQMSSLNFVTLQFAKVTEELKKFGQVISANRLILYGANKRLLAVYQYHDKQTTVGVYAISQTGNDTYLSIEDPTDLSMMLYEEKPIPDTPLPLRIAAHYAGELPEIISTELFSEEQQLGLRISVPISRHDPLSRSEKAVGVLVGEVFYTQSMVARYASLSKTAVNLFAGKQLSIGTLQAQTRFEPESLEQIIACDDLISQDREIEVSSLTLDKSEYYQGSCVFSNAQEMLGAITISLSKDIEKREINKILTAVVTVSVIVSGLAFGLTVVSSRKPVRFIQQLITYINRISKGDIPDKITTEYKGEFNDIKQNMNLLIDAMHEITQLAEEIASGVLVGKIRMRSNRDILGKAVQEMVHYLKYVATVAERIAEGDLTGTVQVRSTDDAFGQAIQSMTEGLRALIVQIRSSADQLAITGKSISSLSTHDIAIVKDVY